MKYTFHTNLSKDECITRLNNSVEKETFFSNARWSESGQGIIGKIGQRDFKLYMKQGARIDFRPYFFGELVQVANGTIISGKFKISFFVKIFMAIWFALPSYISIAIVATSRNSAVIDLLPMFMMIGFGVAAIGFGKYSGKSVEKIILAFITQTLQTDSPEKHA